MLVAEFFSLVKQILVQQVALLLDQFTDCILVCRVIILTQLVLLINLLDYAIATFLPTCDGLGESGTVTDALIQPLCAVIGAISTSPVFHIEHRGLLRTCASRALKCHTRRRILLSGLLRRAR